MYKCALVNVARSVNAKPARGDKYKGPVCPIHKKHQCFCVIYVLYYITAWAYDQQLTVWTEPGRSRSSNLHKTTPSLRDACKKPSGSDSVFLGDSRTPSVINHVMVCSAEFMTSYASKAQ